MTHATPISNRLINTISPYLLQHAHNPVDWYPWGEEAFAKAQAEDKPIFLSIGYSTCHWCHVMAHESFEDSKIADILNRHFVSIKVDKEERPDIDSIYMNVCQSFTGNGGWPMSIFMSYDQKPFYAGTYFPKTPRYGMAGFGDLLEAIAQEWADNRETLVRAGEEMIAHLSKPQNTTPNVSAELISDAFFLFRKTFDKKNGGFGSAPKFPTPHNLIFLMNYYEYTGEKAAMQMAEKTLVQMYRGGIFDHLGYGFSRYSTDPYFLAPHFEKMLYDNALLALSYLRAFEVTSKKLYKEIAQKIFFYVFHELAHPDGGFYCAQDADSEGREGLFYTFSYDEVIRILGEKDGKAFCDYYDITKQGNFEGKNIPNLLHNESYENTLDEFLPKLAEYRKGRASLHRDDKVLTSWNALMIAALAAAYRVLDDGGYLVEAKKACDFIDRNLSDGDTLFASWREGKTSGEGFLDDYAFYIYALIQMYEATFERCYIERAHALARYVQAHFSDRENGGFYLYSDEGERLILRPKETYDGAIPSGNSVMAYNLMKLSRLAENEQLEETAERQIAFVSGFANDYPAGYSFYLSALMMTVYPSRSIICVPAEGQIPDGLNKKVSLNTTIRVLDGPTDDYPLKDRRTTYYVCEGQLCKPPVNEI